MVAPIGPINGFWPYFQIMGVDAGVSDNTLWLSSVHGVSCADPATGAIRADEATDLLDPVASDGRLYALSAVNQVVVVTPPAACFAPG
jgi:hypothetical protein